MAILPLRSLLGLDGSQGSGIQVSDNFNRASANPAGGNWSAATASAGNPQIAVNTLTGTSGDQLFYWNANVFPQDQWAECTQGDDGGPAVRIEPDAANLTGYAYDIGFKALMKWSGGSFTNLGTVTDTPSTTAVYRLEATGSNPTVLKVYKDGVQFHTYSDSSSPLTAGTRVGVFTFGTNGVDNWAAASIGGSSAPATLTQTETAELLTASATIAVSSQTTIAESPDQASTAAAVLATTQSILTEGSDGTAATAGAIVSVSGDVSETSDRLDASASSAASSVADAVVNELPDLASAQSAALASISSTPTESADTVSIAAAASILVIAVAAESADQLSSLVALGGYSVADASLTETPDSVSVSSAVVAAGSAAVTESGDAVASASAALVAGAAVAAESADQVSALAAVGTYSIADAVLAEGADAVSAAASAAIAGSATIAESGDSFQSAVAVTVAASASVNDTADTIAALSATLPSITVDVIATDGADSVGSAATVSDVPLWTPATGGVPRRPRPSVKPVQEPIKPPPEPVVLPPIGCSAVITESADVPSASGAVSGRSRSRRLIEENWLLPRRAA